jgi:hypothetical protein
MVKCGLFDLENGQKWSILTSKWLKVIYLTSKMAKNGLFDLENDQNGLFDLEI